MKVNTKFPRRRSVFLTCCIIIFLFPFISYGHENGIWYYGNGSGYTVTYNSNNPSYHDMSGYDCYYTYKGTVTIPQFIYNSNGEPGRSITAIAGFAFYGCRYNRNYPNSGNLINVRIPNTVTSIGQKAFGDTPLKRVYLEAPTCGISSDAFPSTTKLIVPEGTGDYYNNKNLGVTVIDGYTPSGQAFSGSGSGTKNDPYLIFNPIQLNQVRNFLDEKYVHFKLMCDIDLTDWIADNNPYQGWQPIGTESSPFMGVFNGNNHKIKGLYIKRPSSDNVGFFGYLLWAEISNLTIENSNIQGNNNVGILAGQALDCDIDYCEVSGILNSSGNYVGGIVGCGSGNLSSSISYSTINGNDYIGGIVGGSYDGQGGVLHCDECTFDGIINGNSNVAGCIGYNNHHLFISSFRSMGKIKANGDYAGGVVGYSCCFMLDIIMSYSLCDIHIQGNYAGGIVAYIDRGDYSSDSKTKNIINSYYNGDLTCSGDYVGGIAGFIRHTNINKCYSYANLIGNSYVGGIAGCAYWLSTIYSNVSICDVVSAVSGNVGRVYGNDDFTGVTLGENGTSNENKGLATAKVLLNGEALELPDDLKHGTNVGATTLKLKATYQGMGWDFADWVIVETESYPYKSVQCAPPVYDSNLEAGMTEVSGNSVDGGLITLITNDNEYSTLSANHIWNIWVDPLQAGALVKIQADTEDKLPSYFNRKTVRFGGGGTEDEPYEIYSAEDLVNINSYRYYKLMADIDLTEWINNNNPSGGWIPIGASGNTTMKQLDGNGHKITGLWCDNDMDNCGLFATTYNSVIRDLTLYIAEGKSVKGGKYTGSVVGMAKGTQFENVMVCGDVEGQENVGGIIGYGSRDDSDRYDTSLKSCSFYGSVTGNTYVGGLVGQSASVVHECYSQGSIIGNGTTCFVGGIVGYNRFIVEDCYSSANVVAGEVDSSIPYSNRNQYAGGIVGDNGHTVIHCYSTGNLYAVKCAAGIAGYNTSEVAIVYQCYAMNKKIDVADASGIAMRVIGGIRNGAPAPEANNFALKTMVVSVNNIPQTIYDDLLHGQSLTDEDLRKKATYQNNGWDMNNVWNIEEDYTYPYLRSIDIPQDTIRGDINGDGSVNISDVTSLIDYLLSGNADNINLAGADTNQDGNVNISDVATLIDYLLRGDWH